MYEIIFPRPTYSPSFGAGSRRLHRNSSLLVETNPVAHRNGADIFSAYFRISMALEPVRTAAAIGRAEGSRENGANQDSKSPKVYVELPANPRNISKER